LATAGALPADQAFALMRAQAQKALNLDPSLPEGHAMLGVVAAFLDYDWKESERRFRLVTARDPVPASARSWYAIGLLLLGRYAEAIQHIEIALQGDPLNVGHRYLRAVFLSGAGRDEEGAEAFREILEFNPSMLPAQFAMAAHHVSREEFDQALPFCEKVYALAPLLPHVIGMLAGLLKRAGDTQRSEELLQKLLPGDAFGAPRGMAVYHWVLREFDAEADWFGKAFDQHDPYGALFARAWYGRELRATPRWAGLMRKLNLPES
jgi:tetratricopeptide (TPR) repeat protein